MGLGFSLNTSALNPKCIHLVGPLRMPCLLLQRSQWAPEHAGHHRCMKLVDGRELSVLHLRGLLPQTLDLIRSCTCLASRMTATSASPNCLQHDKPAPLGSNFAVRMCSQSSFEYQHGSPCLCRNPAPPTPMTLDPGFSLDTSYPIFTHKCGPISSFLVISDPAAAKHVLRATEHAHPSQEACVCVCVCVLSFNEKGCTCPASSVTASFWLSPNRLRCEKEALPMKPVRPLARSLALMPPPALRPPRFSGRQVQHEVHLQRTE